MRKKCYLQDFKKQPNQNSIDIPMQTSKTFFVANSKVSTHAHLVQICLKMGTKGMFCSSNFQAMCVITPVMPERTEASFGVQSLCNR